mgnify:CR=1 FL=1
MKKLLFAILFPVIALSQTITPDTVEITNSPNMGRISWNNSFILLRDSIVSIEGQNVSSAGRNIYSAESGMNLQFNSLDSSQFLAPVSNIITFQPAKDADTLKVDVGTQLYILDFERDNTRRWAIDSSGNFFGNTYDALGAADITIGSADVLRLVVTTDGTGNSEVVLPDESISGTEIADGTILVADFGTLTSSTIVADADTVKVDPGTALYILDVEVGNTRIAGLDTTGQFTLGVSGTPVFTASKYGAFASADAALVHVAATAHTSESPGFVGMRSKGSIGTPLAVTSGNILVKIDAYGYDVDTWDNNARISIGATEAWSNTHHGTAFRLQLTDTVASASMLERYTFYPYYIEMEGATDNAAEFRINFPNDFFSDYAATFDTATGYVAVFDFADAVNGRIPKYNSTNKNFDLVDPVSISLAANQIVYATSDSSIASGNALRFDPINVRVGIGDSTSDAGVLNLAKDGTAAVQIIRSWGATSGLRFINSSNTKADPDSTLANSSIGNIEWYSTDNAGATQGPVARIRASATEAHTTGDAGIGFDLYGVPIDSDAADLYAFLTIQPEDSVFVFEGMSNDGAETFFHIINPTTDRTYTFRDKSGSVAITSGDTLSNVVLTSSVEIPSGAGGGTVNASGEITIDTSPFLSSFNWYDGTAERSVSPVSVASISLPDPAVNDSMFGFGPFPFAITIDSVKAYLDGAGGIDTDTLNFGMKFDNSFGNTGPNGSGTAVFSVVQAVDNFTTGERLATFADNTIPADNLVNLYITTKGGTLTMFRLVVYYHKDP